MKIKVLAATLMLVSGWAVADDFQIRGKTKTCADIPELDRALQGASDWYFVDWTMQDYADAITWAEGCQSSGNQFARSSRVQLIRSYANRASLKAQTEANRLAAQKQAEEQKAQLEAARAKVVSDNERRIKDQAELQAKSARTEACHDTKEYLIYQAQENVIGDLEQISIVKSNMAHDLEVSKASGVRDLRNERANGEQLVDARDALKEAFADYRKFGGKASMPQKVTHQLTNPCEE
jgi:hypothetical protein